MHTLRFGPSRRRVRPDCYDRLSGRIPFEGRMMAAETFDWLDGIAARLRSERVNGSSPQGEPTTGRELLSRFGYARRGRWVVAEIREALESRQLRTSPDFEFEWVDNPLEVVLDDDVDGVQARAPTDPTVRVGMLEGAHHTPVSVTRDDPLATATTIMCIHDYSQLPVMRGDREVKGIISWKSIGAAHAQGASPNYVRDCMDDAEVVDGRMPLADAAEVIYKHDYVLVRGEQNKITGILTAVDLAREFKERTYPFLLIGEIEHHIRNLILGRFAPEEFVAAANGDERVRGPDQLTLGGYLRLLGSEERWAKLGISIDRSVFLKQLERVREIRNDVMHFSAEPRDQSDLQELEGMARFCRTIEPGSVCEDPAV